MTVLNNCADKIDPAFFPAATTSTGALGGFPLSAGKMKTVTLPAGYSGRAWGRTGCDSDGNCATGGCPSGGVNCTSPSEVGPTLAQFTIDG